jgi:dihydrodipicolinate synthase/N-acetylneuraminate lyase
MKTTPIDTASLSRSVLAVPPLARNPDLSLNREANRAQMRHLEAGGVTTLLYGGNANLYNVGLYEYAALLDLLEEEAGADSFVIPSVGPDFGKMMDQAEVLRGRRFPTAMVLPQTFPATVAGTVAGIRRFAERLGRPIIVYIKHEGFLTPEAAHQLFDTGLVAGFKYAIVRQDPRQDAFLARLVERVGGAHIVSGIGERPAVVHLRDFGLAGFTSGSVCIAPRGSAAILAALKRRDYATAERLRAAYIPLEDLRDGLSPIRVLHEAVSLAGIAGMGPMLPLLANIEAAHHGKIKAAAGALLAHDRSLAETTLAAAQ